MFSQVTDFAAECTALSHLVDSAVSRYGSDIYRQPTQFKQWTLNDILGHLHLWNWAADTALHNPDHFQEFIALAGAAMQRGQARQFERQWRKDLEGESLLTAWRQYAEAMCTRFAKSDPSARVEWAGPPMSVRSSVTARLMETWSHAQAFYDLVGVNREDHDRIKNIAVLGVNTFKWTFKNRNITPPDPAPYVVLTAPSGAQWTFNEASDTDTIVGTATEFCQVVTQTRNILDTGLSVQGHSAQTWMDIAQCFAGPPETPPAAGTRKPATRNG